MYITCLDLEGVLVPEIWIAFAEETGIPELRLTTRDISDYDILMNKRLSILAEHNLGLAEIQRTIAKIDPLPGAKDFLDKLRRITQVIILSDTFTQFAAPLMEKLGINEKGFALLMNVAPFTVRLWTSGALQPSGTAMRLMQIFETAPEIVSKIAGESKSQMLGRNRRKRDISKG